MIQRNHKLVALALVFGASLLGPRAARAQEIAAGRVNADLSKPDPKAAYWAKAEATDITLMAQPIMPPRPAVTSTPQVKVQAVNDGKWIAFRLRWKDPQKDEAGRLGQFSDGAAIMFPIRPTDPPPAVFMGSKGDPVHIFHWRAQYQRDMEKGKPTMKDLYPNMNVDAYPLEPYDYGKIVKPTEAQKEQFSPGKAAGNPQSYEKHGVDEIYAEGFSTSSVQEGGGSKAYAVWENGEWTLVISRELKREGGSVLGAPGKSHMAFAVWEGQAAEVGSRKCVTMNWTPLAIK